MADKKTFGYFPIRIRHPMWPLSLFRRFDTVVPGKPGDVLLDFGLCKMTPDHPASDSITVSLDSLKPNLSAKETMMRLDDSSGREPKWFTMAEFNALYPYDDDEMAACDD